MVRFPWDHPHAERILEQDSAGQDGELSLYRLTGILFLPGNGILVASTSCDLTTDYLLHLHKLGIDGYQGTRCRQFLEPKAFVFDEILVAIPSRSKLSVKFR
jgi:hypothetical protein